MRDQATALRELRAEYDRLVARPKSETPESFLAKIKRPSPLAAVILIYPDDLQTTYTDIATWLPQLSMNSDNLYLWDQAGLIKNKQLTALDTAQLPFPVLPKQIELLNIQTRTDSARYDFLRNIASTFNNHQEVWITIKASELPYYKYMINAANALCIMLPDNQEAIIKGYEIVKSINSFSTSAEIKLLEFSSKPFTVEPNATIRIKNVAKQFLGIDLIPLGVVLSNGRYFPPINEGGLRDLKNPTDLTCGDFMYSFSENIVYSTLGMN